MSPIGARVIVTGRVQGVGFRAWTEARARELALVGYVRNLPDGTVEAVFEGEESAIDSVTGLLHSGPRLARVAEVRVEKREWTGQFQSFGEG
jgi:acylphosphatase